MDSERNTTATVEPIGEDIEKDIPSDGAVAGVVSRAELSRVPPAGGVLRRARYRRQSTILVKSSRPATLFTFPVAHIARSASWTAIGVVHLMNVFDEIALEEAPFANVLWHVITSVHVRKPSWLTGGPLRVRRAGAGRPAGTKWLIVDENGPETRLKLFGNIIGLIGSTSGVLASQCAHGRNLPDCGDAHAPNTRRCAARRAA